jgi:hypothetical protein
MPVLTELQCKPEPLSLTLSPNDSQSPPLCCSVQSLALVFKPSQDTPIPCCDGRHDPSTRACLLLTRVLLHSLSLRRTYAGCSLQSLLASSLVWAHICCSFPHAQGNNWSDQAGSGQSSLACLKIQKPDLAAMCEGDERNMWLASRRSFYQASHSHGKAHLRGLDSTCSAD